MVEHAKGLLVQIRELCKRSPEWTIEEALTTKGAVEDLLHLRGITHALLKPRLINPDNKFYRLSNEKDDELINYAYDKGLLNKIRQARSNRLSEASERKLSSDRDFIGSI